MDYLIFRLLAPIIAGFNILSIAISIRFFEGKISKIVLRYQVVALLYLISNYFEFLYSDVGKMLICTRFEHLFLQLLVLLWFVFALNYTGYEKILSKKLLIGLFVFITVNSVIIFTNDNHLLFYKDYIAVTKNGFATLIADYGPYFWVVSAFDYVFIIAGVAFVIISYILGGSFYRGQAQFILMGFILPLVVNIIYLFKLIPGFTKDYTPLTFAFTGIFLFAGTYRFRLLHYTPVSRNLILQNIDDALITLDVNYRIIDFNIKAHELFKLKESDLGKVIDSSGLEDIIGKVSERLEENNDVSYIEEISYKKFNIHIKRIYSESGKNTSVVIAFTDISDKMKLIDELKESNKKITEMQNKLIFNEKMAALGQLSAEISHEINNPLTFVNSNCHVLKKYLDNGTFEQNLDDIKELTDDSIEGISRITDIVQNMLSYSREDKNIRRYNINNGIKSTSILAKSIIGKRGEFIFNFGEVPELEINGKKINQVILNLLTNAAYSVKELNNGVIEVETYLKENIVYCEISDNGAEIPTEVKKQMFDPFFTTKGSNSGTGLGLSLSRDIIENEFSGKLYLMEKDKKTFCIELPLKPT